MTKIQSDQNVESVVEYLRTHRNTDFTGYKRASLTRRIHKRMQEVGIDNYEEYIDHLEVHPNEFVDLFNTILINVTSFFRDEEAWNYLQRTILQEIVQQKASQEPIRVWCAGVASGEEAYTIAILLAELLGEEQFRQRVKIYATDLDEEALVKARYARYTSRDLSEVRQEWLDKYFENSGAFYDFRKDLRRSVIFGRHDLTQDAPISRVDLLICRNTLMYFNSETQARILARFHFALNDGGFLFLGKAEMLLTQSNLFTPVDLRWRVFVKSDRANLRDRLLIMAQSGNEEAMSRVTSMVRIRDIAFENGPVAQVVVDTKGHLVLANEKARQLFGLSVHLLGSPFRDIPLSYQPTELRSVIDKAITTRSPVMLNDIYWMRNNKQEMFLNIRVTPLINGNNDLLGTAITFIDITGDKKLQAQLEHSNHELETALEELQSTNEELETTNEELQSTIEELETTNEELQSTNEELETMNEELQSTNEELETMNQELRTRTEELNATNLFLETILSSMGSGVTVLDHELQVQIWNSEMENLWGLRATEVHGRNFLNLDIGLPVGKLQSGLHTILKQKSDHEVVEVKARNRRGGMVNCIVSMTPLNENGSNYYGVVIIIEARPVSESQ